MNLNPLAVFPIAAVAISGVILWNSFHHKVEDDLGIMNGQPSGKYFLLLKETGPGQHESAIVIKDVNGHQTVISGVAKGGINSPVLNERFITFIPADEKCSGTTITLEQISDTVTIIEMGATDPGCNLDQIISMSTILKKL